MKLRVAKYWILGAVVLCVGLFGVIRKDARLTLTFGEALARGRPVETMIPPKEEEQKPPEAETSIPEKPVAPATPEKPAEEIPPPPAKSPEPPPSPPPVVIEEPPPAPSVKIEQPPPEEKQVARSIPAIHTYFINREVRSRNIGMFPRWTGMLSRYSSEGHSLDTVCGPPPHTPCKLKEWKDFLSDLRAAPLAEKLKEVNRYLNKYPYIDDIVNWGFDNYWETPYEFQRQSGNCKDYAIAKYMSLRAIGVPANLMRITVLKDLNLGGIIHAVLVVSDGETSYILDNQIKQLITTDKVYHYLPIYSINEDFWWQHFMIE